MSSLVLNGEPVAFYGFSSHPDRVLVSTADYGAFMVVRQDAIKVVPEEEGRSDDKQGEPMYVNTNEDSHSHFILEDEDTGQLRRIVTRELPNVINHFAAKNREYGENADVLGIRGQFADIWRKIGKLRTGMWDDNPEQLTSESVAEILGDLIGHCLLSLDMIHTLPPQERDRYTTTQQGEGK